MKPIKLLHILRKMNCEDQARKELPPFILHHKISRAILLLELLKYDMPVRTAQIPIESRMIVDYRFTKRWDDAADYIIQDCQQRAGNSPQTVYNYILTDRGRAEALEIEGNLQRLIDKQRKKLFTCNG
jgi:hypothetical protein